MSFPLEIHLLPTWFLDDHSGQIVANGQVRCSDVDELEKLNKGLRLDGGWFSERHIFFAEGIASFSDVPDYFFMDAEDTAPRPVRYFQLTPTDVGVCAQSLGDFVRGVWRCRSNRSE